MLVRSEMLIYKGSVTVFPTHVGVILIVIIKLTITDSIPHTRGGDPDNSAQQVEVRKYSPHTWG